MLYSCSFSMSPKCIIDLWLLILLRLKTTSKACQIISFCRFTLNSTSIPQNFPFNFNKTFPSHQTLSHTQVPISSSKKFLSSSFYPIDSSVHHIECVWRRCEKNIFFYVSWWDFFTLLDLKGKPIILKQCFLRQ